MGKRNPNKILLSYDKRQKDFVVGYPRKCDGNLILNTILGDVLHYNYFKTEEEPRDYRIFNLKEELDKRGYDLTTLKFSIELKEPID